MNINYKKEKIEEELKKNGLYQLKELVQKQMFNYLSKKKIQCCVGVPDSTMKTFH